MSIKLIESINIASGQTTRNEIEPAIGGSAGAKDNSSATVAKSLGALLGGTLEMGQS